MIKLYKLVKCTCKVLLWVFIHCAKQKSNAFKEKYLVLELRTNIITIKVYK